MSKRSAEFKAGKPRPQKTIQSQKWSARQKMLSSDHYRDWSPRLPVTYPTPGRGAAGESST